MEELWLNGCDLIGSRANVCPLLHLQSPLLLPVERAPLLRSGRGAGGAGERAPQRHLQLKPAHYLINQEVDGLAPLG